MSELQRIKNVEDRITLAGLLPDVNLSSLSLEDAVMLKRAALNLYRIGHANGFKAGIDHATNAVVLVAPPRGDSLQPHRLTRRLSTRMCECWQEFKKSLGSIRVAVFIGPRGRRLPNENLNGNFAIRR